MMMIGGSVSFRVLLSAIAVAIGLTSTAYAATVEIDFDELTPGIDVGATYAASGVTFVDARVYSIAGLVGGSQPYGIVHSALVTEPVPTNPIKAIFSSDVASVSLTGINVGANGFLLKAFDSQTGGALLDSEQVFGTDAGSGQFFTLTVAAAGIRRVEFSLVQNTINDGLVFDDFSFETAVPLPASLPLFATGVGALGLLGWRRKKKATALAA
jgi:hypothetical protein